MYRVISVTQKNQCVYVSACVKIPSKIPDRRAVRVGGWNL